MKKIPDFSTFSTKFFSIFLISVEQEKSKSFTQKYIEGMERKINSFEIKAALRFKKNSERIQRKINVNRTIYLFKI